MENVVDILVQGMNSHRKTWATPAFEIISKDIIKGGVTPGIEGSITTNVTASRPEHS